MGESFKGSKRGQEFAQGLDEFVNKESNVPYIDKNMRARNGPEGSEFHINIKVPVILEDNNETNTEEVRRNKDLLRDKFRYFVTHPLGFYGTLEDAKNTGEIKSCEFDQKFSYFGMDRINIDLVSEENIETEVMCKYVEQLFERASETYNYPFVLIEKVNEEQWENDYYPFWPIFNTTLKNNKEILTVMDEKDEEEIKSQLGDISSDRMFNTLIYLNDEMESK